MMIMTIDAENDDDDEEEEDVLAKFVLWWRNPEVSNWSWQR